MKIKFLLTALFAILNLLPTLLYGQSENRELINFDNGWKFSTGDFSDAMEADFDDNAWSLLDLPHDWSIEGKVDRNAPTGGSGGYLPAGTGWYRKHFTLRKSDLRKDHIIMFDGVYMNSDVWLNGEHLGNYPFGYNSFWYSLDDHLIAGENVIAVKVDNSNQPASRWYSGSGIYRHVWLISTDPVHVKPWGIYITTPEISEGSASVIVETRVENHSGSPRKMSVISKVLASDGSNRGHAESALQVLDGWDQKVTQTIYVAEPLLWSPDTPYMYSLVTQVTVNGKIVDEVHTPFGIRSMVYDPDKGFILNGKSVKMNGVCLHHDGGCIGAAVPEDVWERRLKLLKEMGCNAIRTAHNPVAPEFLDLCDKLGFLVMDEIFDEWKIGKVRYGYNMYFDKWAEKDVISFIHRDRNHPSVVMWSAGNEIREQPVEGGEKLLRQLLDIFHKEDPTRPVTVGCDNIAADDHPARIEFLEMLDIIGYNYVDRWHERRELFYSIDKHAHPGWKMVGTESVSNGGVRGSYSLGKDAEKAVPNYNTRMIRAEQLWKFVSMNSYVIGDFMWTGIDYLGEALWPTKNASSGVIDLCGFPKDGYYFYQSLWTVEPMLHIFPHWNWEGREGLVMPVLAYTNCDAVELFVNGRSYGEKRLEFPRQGNSGSWNRYDLPQKNATTADLHLSWDVPYEPGSIKAVGKRNGAIVCTETIETTGAPFAIKLTADKGLLYAGKKGVAHIAVEVVDDKGRVVPTADNMISYTVTGSGKLLGLDNGNPSDHEPYNSGQRKVFNGMGIALIQAGENMGSVKLTASSGGLKDVTIEVIVR
ncbi:MAG: DUF4982 domain-containing protein [Bacteroidales bacterium]|nr:DUF4982 domain-containing protein [Bacteroidales bacterium]